MAEAKAPTRGEAKKARAAAAAEAKSHAPLLEVENLRMYFPVRSTGVVRRVVGHVQAVDGISFALHRGDSVGLVGESGCGKSTTGRMVTRLLEPTGGTIRFEGDDITHLSSHELKPIRSTSR